MGFVTGTPKSIQQLRQRDPEDLGDEYGITADDNAYYNSIVNGTPASSGAATNIWGTLAGNLGPGLQGVAAIIGAAKGNPTVPTGTSLFGTPVTPTNSNTTMWLLIGGGVVAILLLLFFTTTKKAA